MEPDKLMEGISKEMSAALKVMGKAKTAEEKLMYSEIVKNLSESLGVFLGLMSELSYMEDDDGPMPF
ncbi:hypothetical protein [Marinobacter sp. SS8-8]|uniref:hypothetical protein n=1 Tax=Marinobacter sp. SS8-8 TaxID=3050452 RepID=UPI000C60D112|nr:hypothetical protein [Marinobacter sp. SS8-8]MAZ06844.1 hypothetical protein [Halomonas sp.]|tara:strand:- start:11819 stop:12019 length:201 start_codon:yes stop_codon:yes gene_type:complete